MLGGGVRFVIFDADTEVTDVCEEWKAVGGGEPIVCVTAEQFAAELAVPCDLLLVMAHGDEELTRGARGESVGVNSLPYGAIPPLQCDALILFVCSQGQLRGWRKEGDTFPVLRYARSVSVRHITEIIRALGDVELNGHDERDLLSEVLSVARSQHGLGPVFAVR